LKIHLFQIDSLIRIKYIVVHKNVPLLFFE